MKIKLLLTTLISAVAVSSALAGPAYCPPPAKCAPCEVECCDNGSLEVGYQSAYIFRGVRLADDVVFADVNYTFDNFAVPITLGAKHVTSLGTERTGLSPLPFGTGGDHTNLYAWVDLPSSPFGIDAAIGYNHYFYSNQRLPQGAAGHGNWGDSHGALHIRLSKELFCGLVLAYDRAYDFNAPQNYGPTNLGLGSQQEDGGAWVHDISLSKSFCITDCISLDLTGGVLYTDGIWEDQWTVGGGQDRNTSSGWNNYYFNAQMPIALSKCATLVPYIGYTGSPDSWIADGVDGDLNVRTNDNDVFHGGVSVKVGF